VTTEASFEYLKNEGERLLLESLDELEVAFSHPDAKKTDCNHIFQNFVSTVTIDPRKIAEDVKDKIVNRYAGRLMKLKVKYAEIRMAVRLAGAPKASIYRLCISNEAGYLLNMQIYQEVTDPQTGAIRFVSFANERGAWHNLPVNTPYMTKDFLETKRSKAQTLETTYAYDYPGTSSILMDNSHSVSLSSDIFKVSLREMWRQWASSATSPSESQSAIPEDEEMFRQTELVLADDDSRVVERNRLSGENDIAMVAWKIHMKTPGEKSENDPLFTHFTFRMPRGSRYHRHRQRHHDEHRLLRAQGGPALPKGL